MGILGRLRQVTRSFPHLPEYRNIISQKIVLPHEVRVQYQIRGGETPIAYWTRLTWYSNFVARKTTSHKDICFTGHGCLRLGQPPPLIPATTSQRDKIVPVVSSMCAAS